MEPDETADPIGDALRADAEAARAEIRAEGITCPSCGVNMADLPGGHMLIVSREEPYTAECKAGEPASLALSPVNDDAFAKWQAAANVALWDDFRKREAEAFERITGTGPANFTGLLDVLEQP